MSQHEIMQLLFITQDHIKSAKTWAFQTLRINFEVSYQASTKKEVSQKMSYAIITLFS